VATFHTYAAKAMSVAIAIFVKTSSLSPVKTRLGKYIGQQKADEFYLLSIEAIKESVMGASATPFWAVGEEEGLNDPLWADFPALYTGTGNLGERQHRIYEFLLATYERVILIGADIPQICSDLLAQAVSALDSNNFVIGPSRDGGYYLFAGRKSLPQNIWTDVPWSSNETRLRLEEGLPVEPLHLRPLTDVDTKADLLPMLTEMPDHLTPSQQRLIAKVDAAGLFGKA
jgi:glycosyltransferase A (GT-A) superfamily protein (DUF2064 family)